MFPSSALSSEGDKLKLLKEVSLMHSFKHPNVMSLIGLCLDGDVPVIIMPFMSDGSLLEYVRRNKQHLFLTVESSLEKLIFSHVCCMNIYIEIKQFTIFIVYIIWSV